MRDIKKRDPSNQKPDEPPSFRERYTDFVASLDVLAPAEIERRLVALGYKGQEHARRAMALMAYRHLRRIKRIHVEGVARDLLPPKANYLLIGPTGCGKTFLIELIFREILKLPTVILDITAYSETGYVGQDTSTILTRLLNACPDNPLAGMVGIICLDEFDKIATGPNNAVFAGAGTTKDVSGLGVQRELLKMLDGGDVEVPLDLAMSGYSDRIVLPTQDISFVASGAFSGFYTVARRRRWASSMGFAGKVAARDIEKIACTLELEDVEETVNFQTYGLLPELVGRFSRIIPFQPLDETTLSAILTDNVISKFKTEFALEGLTLEVDEAVLAHVVKMNLKKETGARGLSSILTRYLETAAFETFAAATVKTVRVRLSNGEIVTEYD